MNITKRKQGRMVFKTESNEDKLRAFEWIVSNSSFAIIDKTTVDSYSAGAIIALFKHLSAKSKAKFLSYNIPTIIAIAFKIINKQQ